MEIPYSHSVVGLALASCIDWIMEVRLALRNGLYTYRSRWVGDIVNEKPYVAFGILPLTGQQQVSFVAQCDVGDILFNAWIISLADSLEGI